VIMRGRFEGDELISLCALEIRQSAGVAYISGLRTREGRRREGHGLHLTKELMNAAKKMGVKDLRYMTSSMNVASMGLAEQLGFSLVDEVGFYFLNTPFSPHPSPRESFKPKTVTADELYEILRRSNLVPNKHLPYDHEFHAKTLGSLRRIGESTEFRVVSDEGGKPAALYYRNPLTERGGETRTTYAVYCINRTIFVDMMARIVEEAKELGVTRAGFLMCPNGIEWVSSLGYVDSELGPWPGEYLDRRLLLYSKRL
ncbi:MAG: GNAT family N-acetyltransferase, partial [Promethearchaeota archaeon]